MVCTVRYHKGVSVKKRVKLLIVSLVCLAALWLTVPGLLLAQDAISLEGLFAQVQVLTDRLDRIEALWVNSKPLVLPDGACITGSRGGLQDATVLKYKEAFDAWPNTDRIQIFAVNHDPETGIVALQYMENNVYYFVIEFWQGCEFLESSDWWDGGYRDVPFQPPLEPSE